MLVLLTVSALSHAQATRQARILWDANPASENVVSYTVYEQTGPTVWVARGTVPATPAPAFDISLDGLPHTYGVTAYNGFESTRSTTGAPIRPGAPSGLHIILVP